MEGPLKTATAIVGLLAGIVAGLYVLGGLVIALRMLFDSFSLNEIVAIIGQLPRELVVTTAMLDVLLPAATLGLVVGLVAAIWADLRTIRLSAPTDRVGVGTFVLLAAATLILVAPALLHAWRTEGPTLTWLAATIGFLATFLAAYAGWYGLRRVAGTGWEPGAKLLAAGAVVAAVAVIPALLFASSLAFPQAQACVSDSPLAVRGLLVGEGGGRVLLEQHQGREAGIVVLPSDHVTKAEYGDLVSSFVCPLPAGVQPSPKVAEAALGGHGSARERLLAAKLRPHLLFDARERWRPLEVERFVSERFPGGGAQDACRDAPESRCKPLSGLAQLRPGKDAPDYVDIHGEDENGTDFASPHRFCHTSSPPVVDCNGGAGAAIYYRRTTHDGRWYWDYWWFYRYNDYTGPLSRCNSRLCSDHEGDWEGVTVITTPSLAPGVVGIVYAAHKNRILVEGEEAPLEGSHPLAFVAEGTHATYPFRCSEGCRQYATLAGERLPEDSHDGAIPWGGNDDEDCARYHCVRPLPEAGDPSDLSLPRAGAWAGWPGRWGRTCHEGCEGGLRELQGSPRSPGTQTRFRCPWVPTDRALAAPDGSGLSRSQRVGDTERQLAACAAQRGGL